AGVRAHAGGSRQARAGEQERRRGFGEEPDRGRREDLRRLPRQLPREALARGLAGCAPGAPPSRGFFFFWSARSPERRAIRSAASTSRKRPAVWAATPKRRTRRPLTAAVAPWSRRSERSTDRTSRRIRLPAS